MSKELVFPKLCKDDRKEMLIKMKTGEVLKYDLGEWDFHMSDGFLKVFDDKGNIVMVSLDGVIVISVNDKANLIKYA